MSTILGTAAAACSVLTVTRTSSEPACASAITWFTVDGTSAVSVLVMDCDHDRMVAADLHTADVHHDRLAAAICPHPFPSR